MEEEGFLPRLVHNIFPCKIEDDNFGKIEDDNFGKIEDDSVSVQFFGSTFFLR